MMLFLIYTQKQPPDLSFITSDSIQNFKTLFISIILEALPFVLLGVFVAALLQMFVSEQTIRRLTPKNPVLGVIFACVVGIIFPLCECGMIPVIRRLVLKGMPVYIAVVFILAGPIINPVVYASTFMAFRSRPEIAYSRMALAFIVAATIGLIIYRFVKSNPLRGFSKAVHAHSQDHGHDHSHEAHKHEHRNDHVHGHNHHQEHGQSKPGRMFAILGHASDEFFDMGKYLIFGAFLTAVIQTFMSRESLVSIGEGEVSSHLFMMALGYILSLCSTSDAFVASSFTTTFQPGSLLTFLVFGPMLDVKGTLMLLAAFRARFVALLSVLIVVVVLATSLIFEHIFFM
nr:MULTISPECIES: permease [unclassified Paenibacillus]